MLTVHLRGGEPSTRSRLCPRSSQSTAPKLPKGICCITTSNPAGLRYNTKPTARDLVANLFSGYNLGEILSGPQLIVRSGEEGRIQVGQDFSVKERDFAGNIIDRFYSAGTIITVTPQVISDHGVNFVHMKVEVERSSVAPGTISTILNKTKANTNLLLLDGEETIIGGLYNNDLSTERSGVPVLKDLPWYVLGLRYLFGYNKETVTKKELIILLRAELVPTLQERITQKVKEEGVFERWREERKKDEQHIKGGGDR